MDEASSALRLEIESNPIELEDLKKEIQKREIEREAIKKELIWRDKNDSNRKISPLKQADNAIPIDTSDMTIPQQVEFLYEIILQPVKIIALYSWSFSLLLSFTVPSSTEYFLSKKYSG